MSKRAVMAGYGDTHLNVRFVTEMMKLFPELASFVKRSDDFHGFKQDGVATGTDVLVSFSIDSEATEFTNGYRLFVVFTTARDGLTGPFNTESTFDLSINEEKAKSISSLFQSLMDSTLFIEMGSRTYGEDFVEHFFERHFKNTFDTGSIATIGFNVIKVNDYLHISGDFDSLYVAVVE